MQGVGVRTGVKSLKIFKNNIKFLSHARYVRKKLYLCTAFSRGWARKASLTH